MSTQRFRQVISGLLLLLSTLYSPLPASAEPITIKDALGRTITLPEPAKRIVSLAPSITEILFALGLDAEIIGVTTSCDYPAAALAKTRVGGSVNPDMETLIRLKPDLILGIQGLHRAGLDDEMERLGLPVFMTRPVSIERILGDIRTIGRLTGREDEARRLVNSMGRRIAAVRGAVRDEARPRVLYVLWNDPPMTVTASSYIGELIDLAGGRNVIRSNTAGYRSFGMEEALLEDPEVVIFASEMGPGAAEAERERWRRWNRLSAVRENRLYVMNSDLLHRPGPRIVEALESLAGLLHPGRTDVPATAGRTDR